MSTSGVKWAAAVIPIELSIMQPTITVIPCARAIAIIRIASRRLPHFASLMLIPSTFPTSGGMSAAVSQLSSAMTGSGCQTPSDELQRVNGWINSGSTEATETGRNAVGGESAAIPLPARDSPNRPNHAEVANLGYESAALTS